MKNMHLLLVLFSLGIGLFTSSCKKDNPVAPATPPPVNPISDVKLTALWRQPLAPDTSNSKSSMPPIVIGGKVIFSTRYYNPNAEILDAYNTVTGLRVWEWSNYIQPAGAFSDIKVAGNYIVVCTGNEVYVIDSNTGQTVWVNQVQHGKPRIAIIGNYIYHCSGALNTADTINYLMRSPVDHQKWDTVYIARIKDGFSPSIESEALWINSTGDSVIAFQNRSCNYSGGGNQIDFIAYNLNKKQEEFSILNIDPDKGSSTGSITVFQNRLYFLGIGTVYCIDPVAKAVSWSKSFTGFGENFAGNDLFFSGNSLIVKPWGQSIYCLNPSTGSQIWKTDNVTSGGATFVLQNGTLYFMCGDLNAVNFSSGKFLWTKKSPNDYSPNRNYGAFGVRSGIAFDITSGSLFSADDRFAMSLKIPN